MSSVPRWDSRLYLKFAGERTQPAIDLVNRIRLERPARIADLGCGPGNSTEALRSRWPDAHITGLDSSPEMIEAARASYPHGDWKLADAGTWSTPEPLDLVYSNAMLQWLPDHDRICRHLLAQVKPGGALAIQMPAHQDGHLRSDIVEVSRHADWASRMESARSALTQEPATFYYDLLHSQSSQLDLWETTYYHFLTGPEAIVEWFRATGLRPFLDALSSTDERDRFEQMLIERYARSYPRRPSGQILLPFRRLFFVAYR